MMVIPDNLERLASLTVAQRDAFKEHEQITHALDDALIQTYLNAAFDYVEMQVQRIIFVSRGVVELYRWPGRYQLQVGVVRSIEKIEYLDAAETWQEIASSDYHVGQIDQGACITFASSLPGLANVKPEQPLIKITFVAGYGAYSLPGSGDPVAVNLGATAIPAIYTQAVNLIAGWWYEQRETAIAGTISSEVPFAATALINQRRVMGV